jgi:hypothetical protein
MLPDGFLTRPFYRTFTFCNTWFGKALRWQPGVQPGGHRYKQLYKLVKVAKVSRNFRQTVQCSATSQ